MTSALGSGSDTLSRDAQRTIQGGTQVKVAGRLATVQASSELASTDGRYAAAMAFDGNHETAWVEGVDGVGARGGGGTRGETLTVEFEETVELEAVGFVLGYTKSPRVFVRNAAPTSIGLTADGEEIDLLNVSYAQDVVFDGYRSGDADSGPDPRADGCYHSRAPVNVEARRLVVLERPRKVRRLVIEIVEARPGTHYSDTALSEVALIVAGETTAFAPASMAVLNSLRSPDGVDGYLLPGADVQDLRAMYVSPGLGPIFRPGATSPSLIVEGLDGYDAVAWARVLNEDRVVGESPESRYLRYARPSLVGALVTITGPPGGERIVGAPSVHYGDCEWVETYPYIQLRSGRVSKLAEWVTGDGCPGCTWRLPTSEDG